MNYKILKALIIKEFYQILRDPSTYLISFLLPAMLLLIYMFGVHLDTIKVTVGLKVDDNNPEIVSLVDSFGKSGYINTIVYENKDEMYHDLVRSKLHAFTIIPNDFIARLERGQVADLLVVTDGSEVNLSKYSIAYITSIAQGWLSGSPKYMYKSKPLLINPEIRVWYNQNIKSQYFIVPGSLATTMTMLGMLLTALVVSSEWERGTMEGLLATRVSKLEFIISKYIPYFVVGLVSMTFSLCLCVLAFNIPFVGSYFILYAISSLFLLVALGFGLYISVHFKEQFLASQAALAVGFMPALFLSGLVFPICSMPKIIQAVTAIIPTRYYVSFILSEFMAGTVWEIVIINACFLGLLAIILFIGVYQALKMRLD